MDGDLPRNRLIAMHRNFWKALIFGSEAQSSKKRRILADAAFGAGIELSSLSDIDEAREYHLALMSVAARLRVAALVDPSNAERRRGRFGRLSLGHAVSRSADSNPKAWAAPK
jgi:hypothetical protein